ncbi:ectonucleoside triphosphate diphosphohydrolase 2 [Protopterus annectens]|uniref:ectonucleoside triphosphate diphosphohydrolase 2 n=1 Tax=Protopterus annectens TaxID=7888 RepID=UPI001CFAA546|nr:ectonucleoside triphosphate diphosphohydrolase 2 [Protopterus annectens]
MNKKLVSVFLPLLLCLVGVIGIILLCAPSKDVKDSPKHKYGIVFDAGSSHTSMFIYKWPADKENDTGIVSEHSHCSVDGGGISSYSNRPEGAGQSLLACLNQAKRDIPENRHPETPIYLGATAGMRLLNITSPQDSELVFNAVKRTIKLYPFDFRGAKILSGQEEGLFGWVTVNYLLENFVKYGWIGQWISSKKPTVGAMDLGGASTQITFVTDENIQNPSDELRLRLYGQNYKVYTHSFLCYGRDQILRRVLSKVLKANNYGDNTVNPCWPRDYNQTVVLEHVYDSSCTAEERPSPFDKTKKVMVSGSQDAAACRAHVESMIDLTTCTYTNKMCSLDGVFQPALSGNFMAFSAFFYTVDFLKIATKRKLLTPKDLEEAVNEVCNSTFAQLKEKVPDQEKRLADYCAVGSFVDVLITKGYKFDDNTFNSISFQKKAGDTSIGWALGYMLNLTNMIPAEEPAYRKSIEYGSWTILVILYVVVIVLALLIVLCQLQSGKSQAPI